jgi:hypothetical protein
VRNSVAAVLLTLPLAVGATACADDGAGTRTASASGSGSGSASAAGGSSSGSTADGGSGAVPEGVAQQYALMQHEVEEAGGWTRTGDWRVGYVVEAAEPWFTRSQDGESFRAPAEGETHHIEILPVEAATGRLVPDVPVRVEVVDDGGDVVDAQRLSFYHSEFFHYANNFSVPEPGSYDLRVVLQRPDFRVHGEKGKATPLSEGAKVTFEDVRLAPEG